MKTRFDASLIPLVQLLLSHAIRFLFTCRVRLLIHLRLISLPFIVSCYRSAQVFPSITTVCPFGIFTVSLSPLSVCSCILNSTIQSHQPQFPFPSHLLTSHASRFDREKDSLYISSPSFFPCTTFCLKITATSSACLIAASNAGSPWLNDAFLRKLLRASWRAACKTGRSPLEELVSRSCSKWGA